MRDYFFALPGSDDPDSEFWRQWQANIPDFPDDPEQIAEMATWHWTKLYPECPLVPYDVPGWDKSVKNMIYLYIMFFLFLVCVCKPLLILFVCM